jgi:hypothetical protein
MYAWRRFVSILAVIGVLIHASAIVGHNAAALDSALDMAARAVSLGEICDGAAGSDGKSQLLRCPICAGMPGSLLVPAAPECHLPSVFIVQDHLFAAADSGFRELFLFWPPGRGPPLDA